MSVKLHHLDWQPAANLQPLEPGHVHLWVADLGNSQQIWNTASPLTAEEYQRYTRILDPVKAAVRISARGFLRLVLQQYTGFKASELILETLTGGKPSLNMSQNTNGIEFNLSHSGNLALLGVTLKAQIGVDLEMLAPMAEIQHIVAFLPDQSDVQGEPRKLLAAWTRREAYLKALGSGWRGADEPAPQMGWSITSFSPTDYSIGSLAVNAEVGPDNIHGYCFQQL